MKKLSIILMAMLPLLFISCGSDEKEEPKNSSKIVGVWYESGYYSGGEWHSWALVPPPAHEFKSGGVYVEYSSLDAYKEGKPGTVGTYSFDGKNLTVNGGYTRSVTFTADGKGFTWDGKCTCVKVK